MWDSMLDIVALISGLVGIVTGIIGLRMWTRMPKEAGMPVPGRRTGNRLFILGVLVVVGAVLMVASPSHVSVHVSDELNGDVHFEQSNFGGQEVHIKKGDMVIKSSAW